MADLVGEQALALGRGRESIQLAFQLAPAPLVMSSTTRDDYEVPTTVAPQKGESEMGTHPFLLRRQGWRGNAWRGKR